MLKFTSFFLFFFFNFIFGTCHSYPKQTVQAPASSTIPIFTIFSMKTKPKKKENLHVDAKRQAPVVPPQPKHYTVLLPFPEENPFIYIYIYIYVQSCHPLLFLPFFPSIKSHQRRTRRRLWVPHRRQQVFPSVRPVSIVARSRALLHQRLTCVSRIRT